MARSRWRTWGRWFGGGATVAVLAGVAVWYSLYVPPPDFVALAKQDAVDLAQLPPLLRERRVVMVGESHGLIEPVETIKRLLSETPAERPFTHLAMELSISWQPEIDEYFAGDDEALQPFRRRMMQFQSGTIEFMSVFSFVRDWNRAHPERTIAVRLIDVKHPIRDTLEEGRDRHMFEQIEGMVESTGKSRILVYGGSAHATKTGIYRFVGTDVVVPVLGAMLHERHADHLACLWVLHGDESVWRSLDQAKMFPGPVAIRLTPQWTRPREYIKLSWDWCPNPRQPLRSADQLYDYAIWWPTARRGTKLQ